MSVDRWQTGPAISVVVTMTLFPIGKRIVCTIQALLLPAHQNEMTTAKVDAGPTLVHFHPYRTIVPG